METLFQAQSWAMLVLGVALFCVEVFALIEAVRGSAILYRAHGKLTKPAWIALTGVAAFFGFISMAAPVGLPGILAIVAAGVFLADVRPVVVTRRNSRRDGPYGPW